MNKHLNAGVYEVTDAFRAIEQHACVCFDDMGLVAVTGRADDEESQKYADLFAAAPEMLERLEDTLHDLNVFSNQCVLNDMIVPAWVVENIESIATIIAKAKGQS